MSAEGSDPPSDEERAAPDGGDNAGAKRAKKTKGAAAASSVVKEGIPSGKPSGAKAVNEVTQSAFAEGNHETTMTYGHGGLPRYIAFVWVSFLIGYAVYFYVFGLPDLTAWGSP